MTGRRDDQMAGFRIIKVKNFFEDRLGVEGRVDFIDMPSFLSGKFRRCWRCNYFLIEEACFMDPHGTEKNASVEDDRLAALLTQCWKTLGEIKVADA